jgi:hypothetical protein
MLSKKLSELRVAHTRALGFIMMSGSRSQRERLNSPWRDTWGYSQEGIDTHVYKMTGDKMTPDVPGDA